MAITGLEDGYTDWAADFQYDRTIPQFRGDVLSFRGTYIRENSSLLSTFTSGGASLRPASPQYRPGERGVSPRRQVFGHYRIFQHRRNTRSVALPGRSCLRQCKRRPAKRRIHRQYFVVARSEHRPHVSIHGLHAISTGPPRTTTGRDGMPVPTTRFIWSRDSFSRIFGKQSRAFRCPFKASIGWAGSARNSPNPAAAFILRAHAARSCYCAWNEMAMNDVHQLFQAFVAPAIFVSAEGLLLLSLNVRLMGIVSRLRSYLREKHHAAKQGRLAEAEAYASQIASIEKRAEMIRRAFVLTLYGLVGTIAACLLLGAACIGNGPKRRPPWFSFSPY